MDLFEHLSAKQIQAVKTINEDLEIIACAGAGKTGVVTRRIINILKSKKNVLPENIVAFTFTEKAAEELKSRIYKYGETVLGNTTGFANMYVGTIHGFCLKMLQEYVVKFQKFSVLDEIKTKLYIEKNYFDCGMKDLDLKMYTETDLFLNVMR
ncbi:MAG: UvrD-helicase domain-containing protein [Lachnospiraceae bacterium]|nr:UvrD-helicase domain-containing protein [Lachnospiraceae bacterium]